MIVPLLVVVVAASIGAIVASLLGGLLWGLAAATGMVAALHLAKVGITVWESTLAAVGMLTSVMLTHGALTPVPELLTPSIAALMGVAWLPMGIVAGIMVARRHGVGSGINVALVWAGAGLVAGPLASALERLQLGADQLSSAGWVTTSIVVMMLGAGATLSGASGVRGIGIGAAVLVITWFAAVQVGLSIPGLIENIANIVNIPNFWPPDFGWAIGEGTGWWLPSWDFGSPTLANPLVETFQIAIIASLIGCLVALPVSFLASTVTAPGRISYLLDKGFMNVTRTIPDLFWAMVFVAGLGVGPLAGVFALFFFSLAIMSKLLSETIDSVDTGPLEAARATGGSHFPAVRMSVFPQILPNYVAYALYTFELNIRASLILGIVGAGGIGRVLEAQRRFFRFDRVFAVVIIIFVIVFMIEQVSV
ncbi:MAG: phosphonate ABC transporter, permease protein PhnE, partial [Acidimicrobiia bacterium]